MLDPCAQKFVENLKSLYWNNEKNSMREASLYVYLFTVDYHRQSVVSPSSILKRAHYISVKKVLYDEKTLFFWSWRPLEDLVRFLLLSPHIRKKIIYGSNNLIVRKNRRERKKVFQNFIKSLGYFIFHPRMKNIHYCEEFSEAIWISFLCWSTSSQMWSMMMVFKNPFF